MQERFEWRKRFLELGGFDHLYYILITYDFDQLESFPVQVRAIEPVEESKMQTGKSDTRKKKGKQSSIPTQSVMFKSTQSQCLGHLISIIKIFLEAAMLTKDKNSRLLSIIAH